MSADSFLTETVQSLEQAFPDVEPNIIPLGARVLVQLCRISTTTKSGIVLVQETQETRKWNNQVAKIIALGPLAYRNRETKELWPEGMWVQAGDYIRVPRWNGDRIEVPVQGSTDPVVFVVFNDNEIISKIKGNPLEIKTYIL